MKIRSARLAFWNVFYCTFITAILHHWKKKRICGMIYLTVNLKTLRFRKKVDSFCFHTTNANALLTFRIFSWKLVLNSCPHVDNSFDVSGKSLNLSSTNLPWEQQESYVLLCDLYSSERCKLLRALHSFSLSSNECFSTFPLLEAKSFVSCRTLFDVSYSQLFQHHFSFFYLFLLEYSLKN